MASRVSSTVEVAGLTVRLAVTPTAAAACALPLGSAAAGVAPKAATAGVAPLAAEPGRLNETRNGTSLITKLPVTPGAPNLCPCVNSHVCPCTRSRNTTRGGGGGGTLSGSRRRSTSDGRRSVQMEEIVFQNTIASARSTSCRLLGADPDGPPADCSAAARSLFIACICQACRSSPEKSKSPPPVAFGSLSNLICSSISRTFFRPSFVTLRISFCRVALA